MRYLIFLLFIAVVFAPNPYGPNLSRKVYRNIPSFSNITQFLAGFTYATEMYDIFGAINACSPKISETSTDFSDLSDLFKQHQGSLALELIEEDVLAVAVTCIPLVDMVKTHTIELIQIMSDPNFPTLARERIAHNFLDIVKSLAFGIESWKNESFQSSGWGFGTIFHLILSGPIQSSSLNMLSLSDLSNGSCPFLEFTRGFFDSLQVWDSVPDGLKCFDHLVQEKATLAQALELVQEGKILEAVSLFMQTFVVCEQSFSQWKNLFEAFLQKVLQSGFAETAISRLTENLSTLMTDFENGAANLVKLDFYDAGKEFGKIPHLVLNGPDS